MSYFENVGFGKIEVLWEFVGLNKWNFVKAECSQRKIWKVGLSKIMADCSEIIILKWSSSSFILRTQIGKQISNPFIFILFVSCFWNIFIFPTTFLSSFKYSTYSKAKTVIDENFSKYFMASNKIINFFQQSKRKQVAFNNSKVSKLNNPWFSRIISLSFSNSKKHSDFKIPSPILYFSLK